MTEQTWKDTPKRWMHVALAQMQNLSEAEARRADYWRDLAAHTKDLPRLENRYLRWASEHRCTARALRAAVRELGELGEP